MSLEIEQLQPGDAQHVFNKLSFLVIFGAVLFVTAMVLSFTFAMGGGLGGVVSLLVVVVTSIISVPCCVVLFFVQKSKRRGGFLAFALISPIIMWGSMVVGDSQSPENRTLQGAIVMIHALDDYRSTTGNYPNSLDILVPDYIPAFSSTIGPYGWFYLSDGDTYSLGFVPRVDRWSYVLYIYTSETESWDMSVRTFTDGPFTIPATIPPTPTW